MTAFKQPLSLHDALTTHLNNYLTEMKGHRIKGLHKKVMEEIEHPLLQEVMIHTKNNQTQAAKILGLNRITLRTKLKTHDLQPLKKAKHIERDKS